MEDMCYERLRAEAGVNLVWPSRVLNKSLFFFVFQSICEHGSGSGRVRCKNGTCVTSGYAVQAFIVRASFAFVRAQARMQMKCAMSSRGSTHPCCTCRPRAVRGMSIGKNQWPRDWIKRQDRWKDMDRLPTLALAFLLSCARALLRARSRVLALTLTSLVIQRNATAVADAGMV